MSRLFRKSYLQTCLNASSVNDLVLTSSGCKVRVIVMSGDLKDDVDSGHPLVMAFCFNRIQSHSHQVFTSLHLFTLVFGPGGLRAPPLNCPSPSPQSQVKVRLNLSYLCGRLSPSGRGGRGVNQEFLGIFAGFCLFF